MNKLFKIGLIVLAIIVLVLAISLPLALKSKKHTSNTLQLPLVDMAAINRAIAVTPIKTRIEPFEGPILFNDLNIINRSPKLLLNIYFPKLSVSNITNLMAKYGYPVSFEEMVINNDINFLNLLYGHILSTYAYSSYGNTDPTDAILLGLFIILIIKYEYEYKYNKDDLIDFYYNNDYTGQPGSDFTIYLALKTDNIDFQTELLNKTPVTTLKLSDTLFTPLDIDLTVINNPTNASSRTTKIFKFNVIETLNNGLERLLPPDNYSTRTPEQKRTDLIASIKENTLQIFSSCEMFIAASIIIINISENEKREISPDSQMYKDVSNAANNMWHMVGYFRERLLSVIQIN